MRTPQFWYQKKRNWKAYLLSPFAVLYNGVSTLYQKLCAQKQTNVPVPVICVGNVTAGGAGKTPVTAAIFSILARAGRKPLVFSRGYGGEIESLTHVDTDHHLAAAVGDEPLMLAGQGVNIWIGANRARGVKALSQKCGAIIMDDGYQDAKVARDINLLVVDGGKGFGNRMVMPAGPMRENLNPALFRADAVVIVGQDTYGIDGMVSGQLPVFQARLSPEQAVQFDAPVVAFAGIGMPDKFFKTLSAMGAEIHAQYAFADHYQYSPSDIWKMAQKHPDTPLWTTEKDYVRLPEALKPKVQFLPVRAVFKDEARFESWLLSRLQTTGE